MQRILIIGQAESKMKRSIITNGTASVDMLFTDFFVKKQSIETHLATVETELLFDDSNYNQHHFSNYGSDEIKDLKSKLANTKERTAKIKNIINTVKPDFIICNNFNVSTLNMLKQSKYPCAIVIHNIPATIAGISIINKLKTWYELYKLGHSIWTVSPFVSSEWINFCSKRKTPEIPRDEIKHVFSNHVNNNFIEHHNIKPYSGNMICIARGDPDKRVDLALRLMEKLPRETLDLFIGVRHGTEPDNEYWNTQCKPLIEKLQNINVIYNAPRSFLLERLSEAKANIICCPNEACPMTAFESAAFGIPSIYMTPIRSGKPNHSCINIFRNQPHNHYSLLLKGKQFINYDGLTNWLDNVKSIDVRKSIAYAIYYDYNINIFEDILLSNIEKSILKFKNNDKGISNECIDW